MNWVSKCGRRKGLAIKKRLNCRLIAVLACKQSESRKTQGLKLVPVHFNDNLVDNHKRSFMIHEMGFLWTLS